MSSTRAATTFACCTVLLLAVGCPRREPPPANPPPVAEAAPPVAEAVPLRPPPCRELGTAKSPVVSGLQAEILVFDCAGGPVPDILLNGRITNVSTAPVVLNRTALRFAMLVFEVRDATGAIVPGGPPPVPPEDSPELHLALQANADYSWDASLRDVIALDLAPGPYEIRLAYESVAGPAGDWAGTLETGWVRFELPPPAP